MSTAPVAAAVGLLHLSFSLRGHLGVWLIGDAPDFGVPTRPLRADEPLDEAVARLADRLGLHGLRGAMGRVGTLDRPILVDGGWVLPTVFASLGGVVDTDVRDVNAVFLDGPNATADLGPVTDIVRRARRMLARRLGEHPFARELLDATFTISQLRRLYEQVGGVTLDGGNFQRKALGATGFLEPVEPVLDPPRHARSGRPAASYRVGPVERLVPPIRFDAWVDD